MRKKLCPYCKIREKKRVTCGDAECQLKNKRAKGEIWWKKNKDFYKVVRVKPDA